MQLLAAGEVEKLIERDVANWALCLCFITRRHQYACLFAQPSSSNDLVHIRHGSAYVRLLVLHVPKNEGNWDTCTSIY